MRLIRSNVIAKTYKEISKNIKNQDGVFQTTPYIVQILIKLLEEMKTLEESVAAAMDAQQDIAIVPFLPYIFQDW